MEGQKNKNPTKSRTKTWIKIEKMLKVLKGEIGTLVVRTRTRVSWEKRLSLINDVLKQSMDVEEC
ncbi:hypothetical protein ABD74_25065 [Brevibacillus laterosporus]|nr:hypothetical protein [Brevibacillus laterosporus]